LKGSKEFQMEEERLFIVGNLKVVDHCFLSIDRDAKIYHDFSHEFDLVFANGGAQNNDTIPERAICEELGITLLDGLGNKIQSSSWLLK
jgi:hypothetical protein